MPTSYNDQFYILDPASPPPAGTVLDPFRFQIVDANDNGVLQKNGGDTINGYDIVRVGSNDTITVTVNGVTTTITGTTFYLAGHPPVFTPSDGTILTSAVFDSANDGQGQGSLPIPNLGPACFARGSLIRTDHGAAPVEALRPGDRIKTRDAGFQPILWVGSSTVDATGENAPIVFAPNAIGNRGKLRVSPQHRILVTGWQAELALGTPEVFVAAKHLVNGNDIRQVPAACVEYFHVLLPRHHVIEAQGCWSESFFPGDVVLAGNSPLERQIAAVIGDISAYGPTARAVAHSWDAHSLQIAA